MSYQFIFLILCKHISFECDILSRKSLGRTVWKYRESDRYSQLKLTGDTSNNFRDFKISSDGLPALFSKKSL